MPSPLSVTAASAPATSTPSAYRCTIAANSSAVGRTPSASSESDQDFVMETSVVSGAWVLVMVEPAATGPSALDS